jgi:hypothetical protein
VGVTGLNQGEKRMLNAKLKSFFYMPYIVKFASSKKNDKKY